MLACREGKTMMIDMFMKDFEGKFDPSHKSEDHWTPLLYATHNGHSRLIDRLLNLKVDINQ